MLILHSIATNEWIETMNARHMLVKKYNVMTIWVIMRLQCILSLSFYIKHCGVEFVLFSIKGRVTRSSCAKPEMILMMSIICMLVFYALDCIDCVQCVWFYCLSALFHNDKPFPISLYTYSYYTFIRLLQWVHSTYKEMKKSSSLPTN